MLMLNDDYVHFEFYETHFNYLVCANFLAMLYLSINRLLRRNQRHFTPFRIYPVPFSSLVVFIREIHQSF